jgi:hypothetical protein
VTHGLTEHAERLKTLIQTPEPAIPESALVLSKLMQPPTPILRTKDGSEEDGSVNWPQLTVPKSAFEGSLADNDATGLTVTDEDLGEAAGDAWDDELDFGDDAPGESLHNISVLAVAVLRMLSVVYACVDFRRIRPHGAKCSW